MKLIFSIFCGLLWISNGISQPGSHGSSSVEFRGKYSEFLEDDELEIKSWYHYVTSKTKDGSFRLRVFYPEKMQITEDVVFSNKNLTRRNGPYKTWWENGKIQSTGKYIDNEAIGIWTFHHRATGEIAETGEFVDNQREGMWKYYDEKGRIQEEIQFDQGMRNGQFIQYDSTGAIINEGIYKSDKIAEQSHPSMPHDVNQDTIQEIMPYLSICKEIEDRDLRHQCSDKTLLEYIYRNLEYPSLAKKYGIEGSTRTSFVIQEDGSLSDIDVEVGLCDDLAKESIRLISNMPKWEPGIQKNKEVKVKFVLPIKFRLY